ncbi:TetR/AcrR family transcriptional regulator [Streptomyces sp. 1222.5]|uniref:TetR/AcrR family transcriptional regulator n=1 Tax=Streptomyces sp. 1222.5 TaxID=1881026 RepID=UPI000A5FF18B|nr:TetR/AcrR family transcriptional regulator [Streptomyces sp. 1222.5]
MDLGATATELRDVARAAGVTPASVLYYCADIQELFSAVFERSAATYIVSREEDIAAAGPVARLRACVQHPAALRTVPGRAAQRRGGRPAAHLRRPADRAHARARVVRPGGRDVRGHSSPAVPDRTGHRMSGPPGCVLPNVSDRKGRRPGCWSD